MSARGDMRVAHTTDARFSLQPVERVDSKHFMLGSTVHIFAGDGDSVEYRRKAKCQGQKVRGRSRQCYLSSSRASTTTDISPASIFTTSIPTYESLHRPKGYFWRRLFDGSWTIAVVDSEFIIQWWIRDTGEGMRRSPPVEFSGVGLQMSMVDVT